MAVEQRYSRRLQVEFDEAVVQHGKEEGFAIHLVDGDLGKWVITFKGPVSLPFFRNHFCYHSVAVRQTASLTARYLP
jgi:hypothetical protein